MSIPATCSGPHPDGGLVVGHSYIWLWPAGACNTTVVFEGQAVATPDAGTFWRRLSSNTMCAASLPPPPRSAPSTRRPQGEEIGNTTFRACVRFIWQGNGLTRYGDLGARKLAQPVYDHWCKTETATPCVGNPAGLEALPVKVGSPHGADAGYDVQIPERSRRTQPGRHARSIAIKLPLPPARCRPVECRGPVFAKAYLNHGNRGITKQACGKIDEDGISLASPCSRTMT